MLLSAPLHLHRRHETGNLDTGTHGALCLMLLRCGLEGCLNVTCHVDRSSALETYVGSTVAAHAYMLVSRTLPTLAKLGACVPANLAKFTRSMCAQVRSRAGSDMVTP
jgi:hypothetical protein